MKSEIRQTGIKKEAKNHKTWSTCWPKPTSLPNRKKSYRKATAHLREKTKLPTTIKRVFVTKIRQKITWSAGGLVDQNLHQCKQKATANLREKTKLPNIIKRVFGTKIPKISKIRRRNEEFQVYFTAATCQNLDWQYSCSPIFMFGKTWSVYARHSV